MTQNLVSLHLTAAEIAAIEAALTSGLADPDALSTLGRLGAQLVLQR
ncbi:MAG: hypothetical protein IV103_17625, partial [Zoogloea sp.]|nr:hypothetical protein [Zoogloea sp.]